MRFAWLDNERLSRLLVACWVPAVLRFEAPLKVIVCRLRNKKHPSARGAAKYPSLTIFP